MDRLHCPHDAQTVKERSEDFPPTSLVQFLFTPTETMDTSVNGLQTGLKLPCHKMVVCAHTRGSMAVSHGTGRD